MASILQVVNRALRRHYLGGGTWRGRAFSGHSLRNKVLFGLSLGGGAVVASK